MNIDQQLTILKKVKKVEVPEIVIGNIHAILKENASLFFSKKTTVSIAASIAILICVNVIIVYKNYNQRKSKSTYALQMNLISNQNIYSNE